MPRPYSRDSWPGAPVQDGTPIATFSAAKAELVADANSVAATILNNVFFIFISFSFILLHAKMKTDLRMRIRKQLLRYGGK